MSDRVVKVVEGLKTVGGLALGLALIVPYAVALNACAFGASIFKGRLSAACSAGERRLVKWAGK